MSDLVDKVATAIEQYKWDGKSDPDSWKGEAKVAIAATLKALEASLIEDGYSVKGHRIVKIHNFARENGVRLDPD